MKKTMTKHLFIVLLGSALCAPASGQTRNAAHTGPREFPGGLKVRQVDYDVSGPAFDAQAEATILDGDAVYYDGVEHEYVDGYGSGLSADCGYSCPAAWSAEVEAFLMNREGDDRFSASQAFTLSDFEYEGGIRFTLHRHLDCLDGWDITYTGLFDWAEQGRVSGAGLNSVFGVQGPISISNFNNATLHDQRVRSRLHSFELLRKWYGWDVFAVGLGVRYMNVEEDYFFGTVGAGGGTGLFSVETNNNMAGAQLGLEMKVPIGRWTTETNIKGALMGNVADQAIALTNAGPQFSNQDDALQLAALVEFGYSLRYRLTPNVSLQAGYEVWWLYGLAIAKEQVPNILTPNTGRNLDSKGDTWYHGATAGIEAVY